MAQIIKPRERIEKTEYTLYFAYKDDPNAGRGYPCTADGTVIQDTFHMEGVVERYKAFIADENERAKFREPVIQTINGSYIEPAVLKCDCGAEVQLVDPMDNDCDKCGAIYNSSGQRVRCHARDIDPADAGERYDDDY